MMPISQHYEIRMIDIQGLRNIYIPLFMNILQKWKQNYIPWFEELEDAFDWIIKEYLHQSFKCKIIGHYKSDLGDYLLNELGSFQFDFSNVINEINYTTNCRRLKHIKVIVVGGTLIVALLPIKDDLRPTL